MNPKYLKVLNILISFAIALLFFETIYSWIAYSQQGRSNPLFQNALLLFVICLQLNSLAKKDR